MTASQTSKFISTTIPATELGRYRLDSACPVISANRSKKPRFLDVLRPQLTGMFWEL